MTRRRRYESVLPDAIRTTVIIFSYCNAAQHLGNADLDVVNVLEHGVKDISYASEARKLRNIELDGAIVASVGLKPLRFRKLLREIKTATPVLKEPARSFYPLLLGPE